MLFHNQMIENGVQKMHCLQWMGYHFFRHME